jgi:transposase-like protein
MGQGSAFQNSEICEKFGCCLGIYDAGVYHKVCLTVNWKVRLSGGQCGESAERGGASGVQKLREAVFCIFPSGICISSFEPIIRATIAKGSTVHTDEYNIYNRLPEWGFERKTVCHSIGEFARDDDGDGICEVHVSTMEGFWSLLRSWLRPHRGVSQQYFGQFFSLQNSFYVISVSETVQIRSYSDDRHC